jgi:hypothetical protein
MIKKFDTYIKERFHSDKIIWEDLPAGKFHVGDAVELIGAPEGEGTMSPRIGLQGVIIPVQLRIEPNRENPYAHPLSVTEADYFKKGNKKIYQVKTRWPDPDGSHYEFWKNAIERHPRDRNEKNPLSFFELYVDEENLKKIDKRQYLQGLIEFRKRIEDELKKKGLKKAEMREIMKEFDPYGEEDWDE